MHIRKHLTRKNVSIGIIILFIISIVALSTLALQSNQAKNSRAADGAQPIKPIQLTNPPSLEQQEDTTIQYKATIDRASNIQLLGIAPPVTGSRIYTIYIQKPNKTFVHLDTFIATQEMVNARFSEYWNPRIPLTPNDVRGSVFYLYPIQ